MRCDPGNESLIELVQPNYPGDDKSKKTECVKAFNDGYNDNADAHFH